MKSPDRRLAARVIRLMNDLTRRDKRAVEGLLGMRVGCNKLIADHPTVQVVMVPGLRGPRLGLLGVLNGLCGTIRRGRFKGWGMICSVHDDCDDRLLRFGWVERECRPKPPRRAVVAATARHRQVGRRSRR